MSDFFLYRDNDIDMGYRRMKPRSGAFQGTYTRNLWALLLLGGKGIYRVEGTPYPLKAGDILIMRPAESHYIDISPDRSYTRFSVNFKAELLKA